MTVLVLEDKLGITSSYEYHWDRMCQVAGLNPAHMRRISLWRSPVAKSHQLLTKRGNRKTPGFNPEITGVIREWLHGHVKAMRPEAVLCMDLACLGVFESAWDIATIDNLRGGVYSFFGVPVLILPPISAINTSKKPKDIRMMNEGVESKAEWEEEEHDEDEIWIEPYSIPFGRWVLQADLRKLHRILNRSMRV